MAMDYGKAAQELVRCVGGAKNIRSATHCMTRLRLVLVDDAKADDDAVQAIKGVKGVMRQGGQYQVIIGNEVSNVYKALLKLGDFSEESAGASETGQEKPVQRLMGFISGCMTPLLPAMLGTGMLKVLLTLLTTFCGMDSEGSTYILLFSFADCFFYFLPVLLGYTIAKNMGGTPALFMVVGAALCYPDMVTLLGGGSLELGTFLGMDCTYLFGIPVICSTYTSSVLPMLLMAPVMRWAEDFADRVSPNILKSFLKPLVFLVICIPCALCVLGPLGNVAGNALSGVFLTMYDLCPWLTVTVISAIMPFIVMTGMHYAFVPLMTNNFATIGYDVIVLITMYCANLAQGGASFGVAAKSKDAETKSEGIACGTSAVLAGVTEPALYGLSLRYRTPLIGAIAGASVGGLFCGLTGVVAYSYGGSPSLLTLVTYIGGDDPMHGVIFGVAGAIITLAVSFGVTFVLFKDPSDTQVRGDGKLPASDERGAHDDEAPAAGTGAACLFCPVSGSAENVTECSDGVFASEALGRGIVIEPLEGAVYAPCEGEVTSLFETLHAIGITSSDGKEVLIHVGLDTVSLNGKGFTAHVATGDHVVPGQLLLEFDIDYIKSQGLAVSTPMVVTNAQDYPSLHVRTGELLHGDPAIMC